MYQALGASSSRKRNRSGLGVDTAFPIPAEFLAQMLGGSGPKVELSVTTLADAGLISYDQGQMTIADRPGLEKAACECYAVVSEHFRRLQE